MRYKIPLCSPEIEEDLNDLTLKGVTKSRDEFDNQMLEVEAEVNPTGLYRLMREKRWQYAIQRLEVVPIEARIWLVHRVKSDSGHRMLAWRALPLHIACNSEAPDYDLVAALIKTYPKAVKAVDHLGCLPLHNLCREVLLCDDLEANFAEIKRVIDLLLNTHPHGLYASDLEGATPMKLVTDSIRDYGPSRMSTILMRTLSQKHASISMTKLPITDTSLASWSKVPLPRCNDDAVVEETRDVTGLNFNPLRTQAQTMSYTLTDEENISYVNTASFTEKLDGASIVQNDGGSIVRSKREVDGPTNYSLDENSLVDPLAKKKTYWPRKVMSIVENFVSPSKTETSITRTETDKPEVKKSDSVEKSSLNTNVESKMEDQNVAGPAIQTALSDSKSVNLQKAPSSDQKITEELRESSSMPKPANHAKSVNEQTGSESVGTVTSLVQKPPQERHRIKLIADDVDIIEMIAAFDSSSLTSSQAQSQLASSLQSTTSNIVPSNVNQEGSMSTNSISQMNNEGMMKTVIALAGSVASPVKASVKKANSTPANADFEDDIDALFGPSFSSESDLESTSVSSEGSEYSSDISAEDYNQPKGRKSMPKNNRGKKDKSDADLLTAMSFSDQVIKRIESQIMQRIVSLEESIKLSSKDIDAEKELSKRVHDPPKAVTVEDILGDKEPFESLAEHPVSHVRTDNNPLILNRSPENSMELNKETDEWVRDLQNHVADLQRQLVVKDSRIAGAALREESLRKQLRNLQEEMGQSRTHSSMQATRILSLEIQISNLKNEVIGLEEKKIECESILEETRAALYNEKLALKQSTEIFLYAKSMYESEQARLEDDLLKLQQLANRDNERVKELEKLRSSQEAKLIKSSQEKTDIEMRCNRLRSENQNHQIILQNSIREALEHPKSELEKLAAENKKLQEDLDRLQQQSMIQMEVLRAEAAIEKKENERLRKQIKQYRESALNS